jgi:regulatory protein
MRVYLERKATDPSTARPVLARLRENRLLDDARYALEFARHRVRARRQGRFRIARELRARGVADRYIEAAVAEACAESDEKLLVRSAIERRLRALRGPLDERKAASLYRSLLRGGFDAGLVRRELRPALRGSATVDCPTVDSTEEPS